MGNFVRMFVGIYLCMYLVCLLLFHEKTARRIWMKFGTEMDYIKE